MDNYKNLSTFTGFSRQTLEYFWGAYLDNTKSFYENHKKLYLDHVKAPLQLLHQMLTPIALEIDPQIDAIPTRCISRAFNDFRYTGKLYPIKDYMYLHFCASVTDTKLDTPGVFFSANYSHWSCGFSVYHASNSGMAAFRREILDHVEEFSKIACQINDAGISLIGEEYKKDRYPEMPSLIKSYLNKKRFYLSVEYPTDHLLDSPAIVDEITKIWRTLAPLYQFYYRALKRERS